MRLHDIADDPRSVGFPRNHPAMKTFLGVPIVLRGVSYGNLYLTEKEGGGDFTAEDEDFTQLLAGQAAVAIENARLYESSTRWLRQLETLNEIGNALSEELELEPLLALVARRLRELVEARLVLISLPDPSGKLRVVAGDGGGSAELIGTILEPGASKAARVLERARSERVDSVLGDPEIDQQIARRLGVHSGLYVPMLQRGRAIGVVMAHDRIGPSPRFTDGDVRLAETLVARAAIAVDLTERVSRDAVRRVIEAQELERKRLARELHDETGQALTSILLGLKSIEHVGGVAVQDGVESLRGLVVETLQNVRRLAVELRPSALDDFGLVAALDRLAATYGEQIGLEIEIDSRVPAERLPQAVETTLYRVVQEALTNVVKHADASRVSILVVQTGSSVTAVIEDDGQGFDATVTRQDALGLTGMRERAALVRGKVAVESSPGSGTTVRVEVPLQ